LNIANVELKQLRNNRLSVLIGWVRGPSRKYWC